MGALRISDDVPDRGPPQILKICPQPPYATPWIKPNPALPLSQVDVPTFAEHPHTTPESVNPRQGTRAMEPMQIHNWMGLRDPAYLDPTGLSLHRGIRDPMR